MSCAHWRDLLSVESIDQMAAARRAEFLIHLQGCTSCRRAAAEADPTVVFSLLPEEKIEEGEIEEIRRTVQTMRRVRALEASWSQRARQGVAVGAFAALILLAVLLLPEQPDSRRPQEVPFAGAVGVGSGLVSVPLESSDTTAVELQVELARSARMADLSSPPALQGISHLAVTANAGEFVDRDLGNGYRIRFKLAGEASIDGPVLEEFQLLRPGRVGEEPLFSADLKPLANSPLILSVASADQDEAQLWLLLTYSVKDPAAR